MAKIPIQNVSDKIDNVEAKHAFIETITDWLGSTKFIAGLAVGTLLYVVLNTSFHLFDPFPFLFLSTVVNVFGLFTIPILLKSAKAQAEKDEVRDDYEYEMNIRAEANTEEILRTLVVMHRNLKSTIINVANE